MHMQMMLATMKNVHTYDERTYTLRIPTQNDVVTYALATANAAVMTTDNANDEVIDHHHDDDDDDDKEAEDVVVAFFAHDGSHY